MHSNFRLPAAGLAAAVALAAATLLAPAMAQQPFQLPTATGPTVTGFGTISPPLQAVGTQVLARRTSLTTDQVGTFANGNTLVFSPFLSRPIGSAVPDPVLERGVTLPSRIFFTETIAGSNLLRAATTTGVSTLATLPAGSWRLQAVSLDNSRFILFNSLNGQLRRVDVGPAPLQVQLATVVGASSVRISPNGQVLSALVAAGGPITNFTVVTTSALANIPVTNQITTTMSPAVEWLDDRFLAIVQLGAPATRVLRLDTATPGTSNPLTMAPVAVDPGVGISVSDNHEWLAFVTQQNIAGSVERVPAVMRTSNAATAPNGVAGPGGAYIELGDYRQLAPVGAYTNWNLIERPVVTLSPAAPTTSSVRVVWRGRRVFGAAAEMFRGDVWDDLTVPSRGQNGTMLNVQTVAPPFATFCSLQISFSRPPAPVSLPAVFDNHQLVQSPATLFFVAAAPGAPLSIPITLPSLSGLPPINMLFQAAWFTSVNPRVHLSHVTELPVF